MKQLILSAGMLRSGSTWLYNAMRILLSTDEEIDLGAGWIQDIQEFRHHDTVLVKLHGYEPRLASNSRFTAYSYRDLRDVIASMKRKFDSPPSIATARQLLVADAKWRDTSQFIMKYEDMISAPHVIAEKLGVAMGLTGITGAEISREITALTYDSSESTNSVYNSQNLLHKGHITHGKHGSWTEDLEPGFVSELESEFSGWLVENGYTV